MPEPYPQMHDVEPCGVGKYSGRFHTAYNSGCPIREKEQDDGLVLFSVVTIKDSGPYQSCNKNSYTKILVKSFVSHNPLTSIHDTHKFMIHTNLSLNTRIKSMYMFAYNRQPGIKNKPSQHVQ